MKILDQYLYAITRKLPYNSRKEIKMELYDLLMDEIESTYGQSPTEAEATLAISAYGSPREVANRYKTNNLIIGEGYTDLFVFIAKIVAGALGIAFTTIFVVDIFQGDTTGNALFGELAKIFLRTLNGWIGALGWLTLIFIILTRINNDHEINLDEDWTPEELKDIQVGPEVESRLGSALSIFFILVFTIVINAFPGLITLAEKSFDYSGLLGHNVDLAVFKFYLIPLSVLWLLEVVHHIFNLFYGSGSRNIALFKWLIDCANTILLFVMFANTNLYMNVTSMVGFRLIFGGVGIISIIEVFNGGRNFFKYYG